MNEDAYTARRDVITGTEEGLRPGNYIYDLYSQ